jgi:hypothetical protein
MERHTMRLPTACLCAALLALSGSAHAGDGVIEISHAAIVAAGGYPYTITTQGSYVLTSNLQVTGGGNGIEVQTPNVTIDLNGFTMDGNFGGLTGINTGNPGLTVRNGTITGFGGNGIVSTFGPLNVFQVRVGMNQGVGIVGNRCLIAESVVESNFVGGIQASRCRIENNNVQDSWGIGISGDDNVIVHNNVMENQAGGIFTTSNSTIQENTIKGNGQYGISDGLVGPPPPIPPVVAGLRLNIRGNTINSNGGPGITIRAPALISGNTIASNWGTGIVCSWACAISDNVIETNNNSSSPTGGGVFAGPGSNVTDNSISFNINFGLILPITSGYSQNTLNANNPGPDVVLSPAPGPHPTSGYMNLCSGQPGPHPINCP